MITHYLTVAIRNLLKYKVQNLISILGMAVGLFCFCICFYISRFVGSVDTCFENHERIADLYLLNHDGKKWSGVSGKLVPHLRQRHWDGVEAFTLISYDETKEFNVVGENDELLPYKLSYMETDSLYLKVFTPTLISGNWTQASIHRNSIVLTEPTAKRIFGDVHRAIGRQMMLPKGQFTDGSVTYTVQAVIRELPENTSMNFMQTVDMLTLNDDDGYLAYGLSDITGYHAYALLNEGYTHRQLDEAFQQAEYTFPMFNRENPVRANRLGEDHSFSTIADIMGLVTALVGFLVLLTASLNFFHFQTGSFLNRGREFSIRKILGNTTSSLFWMQFVQIAIVIFFATLISGCLIELASPFLSLSLFRFSIQMTKEDLIPHLFQYMGCLLLLTALVSLGIALYIRHATMRISLHGLGNVNGKKHLRNILLGVQFFICWLFVSMTVGLYLQSEKTSSAMFDTLTRQEKEEIICLSLNYSFMKTEDRRVLINQIRQHSGIRDMMFTDHDIASNTITAMYDSLHSQRHHDMRIMGVTSNYAQFMNVGLEGRSQQSPTDILVSRKTAEKLGGDVIGKPLYNYQRQSHTITGIMDNVCNYVYNDGYGQADYGTAYFLIDEAEAGHYGYVKCYPGKIEEVQQWIEGKMREMFPASIEVRTTTLQKGIEEYQALENSLKGIILCFSIICLIITGLGVYSAITLDTERRQKEVAIRKVNGAGLKEIIALFARLYLWMLGISAIFAFPIVYLILQTWKQMYQVFFNTGILYWGGILLGVTGITALTVIFRILKIARINPAEIIKSE